MLIIIRPSSEELTKALLVRLRLLSISLSSKGMCPTKALEKFDAKQSLQKFLITGVFFALGLHISKDNFSSYYIFNKKLIFAEQIERT